MNVEAMKRQDKDSIPVFRARIARFINYFVETEDMEDAAKRSGLTADIAAKVMRNKKAKTEIERRLDLIHAKQAELLAEHRHRITVPFLDDRLVLAVDRGSARGDVQALELGYKRVGMMRDREFIGVSNPAAGAAPGTQPAGSLIYRATEKTTTVTTTERAAEVVDTGEQPTLPAPKPPVILQY